MLKVCEVNCKKSEIIAQIVDFLPSECLHFWEDVTFQSEALKGRWGSCKPHQKVAECWIDPLQALKTIVWSFMHLGKQIQLIEISDILTYTPP